MRTFEEPLPGILVRLDRQASPTFGRKLVWFRITRVMTALGTPPGWCWLDGHVQHNGRPLARRVVMVRKAALFDGGRYPDEEA